MTALPRDKTLVHLEPKLKVWLEAGGGRIAFSDYRLKLLEAVGATGSLAEAAAEMGLSYRRAWGKIRELEENLGVKLVQTMVGGAGGGATHLAPEAADLIRRYTRFRAALQAFAEREFVREFKEVQ